MLPSFGFGEMVIIVLLAVIVVGPKDLPKVMRTLGGFMARLRVMGQEFRDAFDEMDADDEIKALRAEIAEMKSLGLLDDDLKNEMRDLDTDLRRSTDLTPTSPKATAPKPISSQTASPETPASEPSSDAPDKS